MVDTFIEVTKGKIKLLPIVTFVTEGGLLMKLIEINTTICWKCKYHTAFGPNPGHRDCINNNVCCNYLYLTGQSRIFSHGVKRYDPKYCDKFEPGKEASESWTSESMEKWVRVDDIRRKFWKELGI